MEWWYFLIVGICCVFSAFFSCADLVYGAVDKDKLSRDAENGHRRAKVAYKLASDYEFSISSILFGNNVVNIVASSIVTLIGIASNSSNPDLGATISAIIFTVLVIVFCEFIPKAIGKRFVYRFAIAFAYPVTFFKYLTFIFVWPISKLFVVISKLFKKKSIEEDKIDEDVLTEMVDTIEEEGMLEEGEADLVRSAIDLNDIEAFEVMTPRVDVFAIDVEDDIKEILKENDIYIHSRIPVYEETIDNIIGVVALKDLLKARLKGEKINLKELCYKPIFVPRNHQVLDMLQEFKESKIHIAVVVDEYGGTEGIITMEDLLEEVVGDIFDEMDEIKEESKELAEGKWLIDGSMNIDDFFELIGFEDEFETDYSTVGGLCQEILDDFGKVGDKFNFFHYTFEVIEAEEFTVEKVIVTDNNFQNEE